MDGGIFISPEVPGIPTTRVEKGKQIHRNGIGRTSSNPFRCVRWISRGSSTVVHYLCLSGLYLPANAPTHPELR